MSRDNRSAEEIWSDRAERAGNSFTRHPFRWIFGAIAIFIAISLIGGVLGFFGSWFGAGKEIFEPKNVKEQYEKVITLYNGMERQAEIACDAKNAAAGGESRQGPTFLEDPALAYENKYRELQVDYDQRQANIFKSKLVGPKGYPRKAPTIDQMQAQLLTEGKGGC